MYHCWLEDLDHSEDIRDRRTVLTHEGNYGDGGEPGGDDAGDTPVPGGGGKGGGKGKGKTKTKNNEEKKPKQPKEKPHNSLHDQFLDGILNYHVCFFWNYITYEWATLQLT